MKRLLFLIVWLYTQIAAAQTSNLPSSMGTFTVFKEADSPVTIIMPVGYNISNPVVEVWNNGEKLSDSTAVTIAADTIKFTLRKAQLADLTRNPYFFLKLNGSYALGAVINPTIGVGVPTTLTKTVTLPSAGTVRVSLIGDASGVLSAASAAKQSELSAASSKTQALTAKTAAESARDAALIQGGVYPTEAAGRAGVADGQAFKVQGVGDIAAYEYRRTNSSTSVLITTYPSGANVSNIEKVVLRLFTPTITTNSFVSRATGDLAANSDYRRTQAIPLSSLGAKISIDIGNFGGSIAPVAYYNSSTISNASYVGNEIPTFGGTFPGTSTQLSNYILTIPAGATHVVFTCHISYVLAIRYFDPEYVRTLQTSLASTATNANNALVSANDAKSIAYGTLLTKFNDYTVTSGSYIVKATGAIASNPDYSRTSAIPLSTLQAAAPPIKIDIGNFGGSIAAVAYYNSATIGSGTYVGNEVVTFGGTYPGSSSQLTNYTLTIPAGATHVVFTVYKTYFLNIYSAQASSVPNAVEDGKQYNSKEGILITANIYSKYSNPFQTISPESEKMFRRAGKATIPSDVLPLILVFGQSNADGRVPQASAPSWLSSNSYRIDNLMMWDKTNNAFNPYQLGVNTGANSNNSTQFGFDIFFAKAWLDANPGKKLYCIKHTLGGVPISEKGSNSGNNNARWQPKTELITAGQIAMVDGAVAKVQAALAYAKANRLKLMPIIILYHQGEGDADRANDGAVTDYPVNLANLMSYLRGLLQAPALPFVNGTVVNVNANYSAINNVYPILNNADPNMKTVDMSGNQTTIDGLHYDATALQYMGQQMYNYYIAFSFSYFQTLLLLLLFAARFKRNVKLLIIPGAALIFYSCSPKQIDPAYPLEIPQMIIVTGQSNADGQVTEFLFTQIQSTWEKPQRQRLN